MTAGAGAKKTDRVAGMISAGVERTRALVDLAVALFSDITERKNGDLALLERGERQQFQLKLSDALRAEQDEGAVARRALSLVADQLGVDRCYLAEVNLAEDCPTVLHRFAKPGAAPVPDAFRLSDFPELLRRVLQDTVEVTDSAADSRLDRAERESLAQLGFAAFVATALRQGAETPTWALVAVSATPRAWPADDVELIEEATERIWAATERCRADVERRRVEKALRASEERYRTLFESIDEGFAVIEVLFDDNDETAVGYVFLEANGSFERQFGRQDVVGRSIRGLVPTHEEIWFERFGYVARTGEPVRFDARAEDLHRWFAVSAFRVEEPSLHRVAVLLTDVTERKRADVLALREHRLAGELAERRRWARELHDTSLQSLGALHMHLVAEAGPGEQDGRLAEAARIARAEIRNLRSLIADLHPPALTDFGLEAALTALRDEIERYPNSPAISIDVDPLDHRDRLPPDVELIVYRVVQEAIRNAAKHSGGARIEVEVRVDAREACAYIRDDGHGFDPQAPTAGFGLLGMRERARLAGGTLAIDASGKGTTVTLRLPLVPDDDELVDV